jgi:hypothetical protein
MPDARIARQRLPMPADGYSACSTNASATPITLGTMASAMPSSTCVSITSVPEESLESVGGQFSVADGQSRRWAISRPR